MCVTVCVTYVHVTGIEMGVLKVHNGSCMVGYGKQVGETSRCTGKSAQLCCTYVKVFPTQSAEADESDVI